MLRKAKRPLIKRRQRGRLAFKAIRLRVGVEFSNPYFRIAPEPVRNFDAAIATLSNQALVTKLIQEKKVDTTFLITHRSTDLADGPELYQTFKTKKDGCAKVVFHPQ